MEPPHRSGWPLSEQLAGDCGEQVQVPAVVAFQPTQALFWCGAAVEQLQVRLMPPGPSWKTLSGPSEHGLPTLWLAP